jgi:hypothetical protein
MIGPADTFAYIRRAIVLNHGKLRSTRACRKVHANAAPAGKRTGDNNMISHNGTVSRLSLMSITAHCCYNYGENNRNEITVAQPVVQ